MNSEKLIEIKNVFMELEGILAQESHAETVVAKNQRFKDIFLKAHKCLGILWNEWILEDPAAFDSRDELERFIEHLETIQCAMEKDMKLPNGDTLSSRLAYAKEILVEVNKHMKGGE